MGIDLLKAEIKKELLSITVLRVEEIFIKLLEKSEAKEIMQKKGSLIFLQCIKKSCEDFLTKQYGYKVRVDLGDLTRALYTKNLIKDIELIFQVPFMF